MVRYAAEGGGGDTLEWRAILESRAVPGKIRHRIYGWRSNNTYEGSPSTYDR